VTRGGRRLLPLAWVVFALVLLSLVMSLAVTWAVRRSIPAGGWDAAGGFWATLAFSTVVVAFPVTGILIARRKPGNAIAWILLAIGACWILPATPYAAYSYLIHPLPLTDWVLAFGQWTWVPAIGLIGTYLILLFPDGHLPSPRWRWLGWLSGITLTLSSLLILFSPGLVPTGLAHPAGVPNPFELHLLRHVPQLESVIALVPLCIVLCAVSLLVRFRRSRGLERQQLKWLVFAASVVAVAYMFVMAVSLPESFAHTKTPPWVNTAQNLVLLTFILIPVAIGFAVLRYHLYDINVIISKTVIFGALALFITLVYVALVVGLGTALGDAHDPVLSIAATAVVALAFGSVRTRVRRVANRLVYGKRATPYEVMAGFSRQVAGTLSIDELLPEMAEASARGVGARVSRVQVLLPGDIVESEVWPRGADVPARFDRTLEVRHQGSVVGRIEIAKPPDEPLTSSEEGLLSDLAAQAGLALHNVALARELEIRAHELETLSAALRLSRQRLVTARDAQRRGLERDIREGPQHRLEEIAAGLAAAEAAAASDPRSAGAILERLNEDANVTLEGLRDLARGIFPPLLADKGIVAALDAYIRKGGVDARIDADDDTATERFDADVEAAAYFCGLQALQNVVRHTGNAPTTVRVRCDHDQLVLEIHDDGPGFDVGTREPGMGIQIMQDRVDALDGSLEISSERGNGTLVRVALPTRTLTLAGA
jgi:signal transduction histidine kinase